MSPWPTCLTVFLTSWSIAWGAPSPGPADGLDSLLAVQQHRAGSCAAGLFAPLNAAGALTDTDRADFRFLLANLPLSDLVAMRSADLMENVRLARRARTEFPWGAQVSDELFRHYVLPHRVSQEPFTRWRARFLNELAPRVAGLTMSRAALEVNHWCHEQATYRPTDGRDQDPLTTIRAGYGRCEEEMILSISALRSVGIPARQCYTPYWAHMNDNHAWVEVWADGAWSYFGACEPAPALGQAWFTDPARRSMLVVSQAYGSMQVGAESVLRAEGRSSSINSTAVYGPVKPLRLFLLDANGRPLAGQRAVFHLYNYGGWMPALALESDAHGRIELTCGLGSWLITAGEGRHAGLVHVSAGVQEATLMLDRLQHLALPGLVDYTPPPKVGVSNPAQGLVFAEGLARGLSDTASVRLADQDFQHRMQWEDSLREARVWAAWVTNGSRADESLAPDSLRLQPLMEWARGEDLDPAMILDCYQRARGNWFVLHQFLTGEQPVRVVDGLARWCLSPAAAKSGGLARRMELLDACSDKDLCEIGLQTLRDHEAALAPPPADSLALARWRRYVLPPRLDGEPCLPWRGALSTFLEEHAHLQSSRADRALRRWVRRELRVDEERDRLGAPFSPAQVLELGGGTRSDIARLYLGLCRVRGIPARVDPLTKRLERWEEGAWRRVELFGSKGKRVRRSTGRLTILAADSLSAVAPVFKDWCLARWETDRLEAVDLGWEQPLSAIEFPLELPVGRYLLSSGRRREDGSATVRLQWVSIAKNREASLRLSLAP